MAKFPLESGLRNLLGIKQQLLERYWAQRSNALSAKYRLDTVEHHMGTDAVLNAAMKILNYTGPRENITKHVRETYGPLSLAQQHAADMVIAKFISDQRGRLQATVVDSEPH